MLFPKPDTRWDMLLLILVYYTRRHSHRRG